MAEEADCSSPRRIHLQQRKKRIARRRKMPKSVTAALGHVVGHHRTRSSAQLSHKPRPQGLSRAQLTVSPISPRRPVAGLKPLFFSSSMLHKSLSGGEPGGGQIMARGFLSPSCASQRVKGEALCCLFRVSGHTMTYLDKGRASRWHHSAPALLALYKQSVSWLSP